LTGADIAVRELGEHALIARIRARVPPDPDWVTVGIGDDAAVIEPERGQLEVVSTDALVEGIHFDRQFCPARDLGLKALASNLSDLAAMGAAPRAALLSLVLPPALPVGDVDHLLDGLLDAARRYRAALIGGNIASSPGPLVITLTVTGSVRRRRLLRRDGARPGDELYLSGAIGGAAAGLGWLKAGRPPTAADLDRCAQRYLRPEPRVRLGMLLGRNRAARACIDLSDGLADAVRQLGQASGVGAVVDASAVPVEPAARVWFERQGLDPLVAALEGGEDYELLLAVPRARVFQGRLRGVRRLIGDLPLTRIGEVTASADLVLRRNGTDHPLPRGYEHFTT